MNMCLLRNGEKMYLNTLGKNEMYASVAEIVGADVEDIKRFVIENAADIVDCHYDEYSIEQMDLKGLLNGKELKLIDSLIMHHITPRESEESIWQEGLMTLSNALTQKTILADYLKKWGFTFSFDGNKIVMSRKGLVVDVENKLGTNLKMRLGGPNTLNDYNVNGYLFVDEFEEEAIRGWLGSPEFLKSLAYYYDNFSIANNYADNSHNYYVSFEVPLDMVDIEGFSATISVEKKTSILLRYTINALAYAEMKRKPFLPMYNPIIFLKRQYDVPKEDIRKIWILYHKPGKWFPVEIV